MTEPEAKPVAAPPARGPRWMRIALAVSLALNLAVAGVVAGAILRDGNPRTRQDFGLGPLSEALTREDRRALREAFLQIARQEPARVKIVDAALPEHEIADRVWALTCDAFPSDLKGRRP